MDPWLQQALFVGVGGFLGAVARLRVGGWITERWGAAFPYGTLFINVSGSFVIGLLLAIIAGRVQISPNYRLFFVTGFLGAYTTFSTFSFESVGLIESGQLPLALLYIGGSVAAGLVAVVLGTVLGRLLT